MRHISFSNETERQQLIANLTTDVLLLGERNINLDEHGVPQTNELIVEDDPGEVARILAEREGQQDELEEQADMLNALTLVGVEPDEEVG